MPSQPTVRRRRPTRGRQRNARQRTRRGHKQRRFSGGLFGATRDAFNSGDKQQKQGEENVSYRAVVRQSGWTKSTTDHPIEYIVPNNFVALKNPNSFFTPRFTAHIGGGQAEPCYFRIAEPNRTDRIKFLEYFIHLRGDWYGMMRVYGLNAGLFATLTNVVFYKFTHPSWFHLDNNSLHFPADAVRENHRSELNLLQRIALKDDGRIFQLIHGYEAVTSGEVYEVLRQFRNGQLINASAKEEMAVTAAEIAVDMLR